MNVSQTTNNQVKVGLLYGDGTTRTYSFDGVADSLIPDVKSKIVSINNDSTDNFHKTFVSDAGADVIRIATGTVVSTIEEIVYEG